MIINYYMLYHTNVTSHMTWCVASQDRIGMGPAGGGVPWTLVEIKQWIDRMFKPILITLSLLTSLGHSLSVRWLSGCACFACYHCLTLLVVR